MRRINLLAAVSIALLTTACGDVSAADETIVVYSGRSLDLIGDLVTQFEDETGIQVDIREGDSTELAATLLLEGANSPADIFLAQDPASLGIVASSGLLTTLPGDILSLVPERFSDRGGNWVGISGRTRSLVYNCELVDAANLPSSIQELTDPRWAGKIGVAPTNSSFQAFVAAMILTSGQEATLSWLQDLAAIQPVDFPANSPIVAAVDAGDVSVGLVNHYYLLRLEAEQGSVVAANHFFSAGDAGSLVMPSGAGILATSQETASASRFIEFLLSEEAQQHFASQTFEYPLTAGVEADPRLPSLESIVTPDIDLSDLADALELATDLISEAGLI